LQKRTKSRKRQRIDTVRHLGR